MTTSADSTTHLIGLLLGTEDDWPRAFETLVRKLGSVRHNDADHTLNTERITIEPFDLRDPVRHDVVIDRLAWWYYHPREWLKKAALVNGTYLLNNPFTFQAMEKHSAYCAMIRLGFDIPPTVLVPYKNPLDHEKWAYTASTYNLPFDLDEVAGRVGFPMFMKPFDGGAWRGVSRVDDRHELHRAYDASGQMLMHLQAAISPYDAFARSLTIGPETMIMNFRPELPMHLRYEVAHDFLAPEAGSEILTLSRSINAFFRWEFNSCEALVTGTAVRPIDFANACPDIAITSLHYYFPWAIQNLISWSIFCAVTGRAERIDTTSAEWFAVADDPDLDFGGQARGVRQARGRLLRGRPLPRVLRDVAGVATRTGPLLDRLDRIRRPADRDGPQDLPGPRTRQLRRPLPRPDVPVGQRQRREFG